MSDVIVKELSKELINRANSVSFSGTRGNNSEHDYKIYVQKILKSERFKGKRPAWL